MPRTKPLQTGVQTIFSLVSFLRDFHWCIWSEFKSNLKKQYRHKGCFDTPSMYTQTPFDCMQGAVKRSHHRCRSMALPSKICRRISKPDFFSRKKIILPLICRRNYEPKFFCGKKLIPTNMCPKNKNADHITCRNRYTLRFLCHHKVWVLLQCRNNDIPFKYCH